MDDDFAFDLDDADLAELDAIEAQATQRAAGTSDAVVRQEAGKRAVQHGNKENVDNSRAAGGPAGPGSGATPKPPRHVPKFQTPPVRVPASVSRPAPRTAGTSHVPPSPGAEAAGATPRRQVVVPGRTVTTPGAGSACARKVAMPPVGASSSSTPVTAPRQHAARTVTMPPALRAPRSTVADVDPAAAGATGAVTPDSREARVPGSGRRRRIPGPAGDLPPLAPGEPIPDRLPGLGSAGLSIHGAGSSHPGQGAPGSSLGVFQGPGTWSMLLEEESEPIRYTVAYVHEKGYFCKVPRLAVLVVSISYFGVDAAVVFRDPTGTIEGTVHQDVLLAYPNEMVAGTAILLRDVSVFSPTLRERYLNITPENVVRVVAPALPATQATQDPSPGSLSPSDRAPQPQSPSAAVAASAAAAAAAPPRPALAAARTLTPLRAATPAAPAVTPVAAPSFEDAIATGDDDLDEAALAELDMWSQEAIAKRRRVA